MFTNEAERQRAREAMRRVECAREHDGEQDDGLEPFLDAFDRLYPVVEAPAPNATPSPAFEAALDRYEIAIGRRAKRGVVTPRQVLDDRAAARAEVLRVHLEEVNDARK